MHAARWRLLLKNGTTTEIDGRLLMARASIATRASGLTRKPADALSQRVVQIAT